MAASVATYGILRKALMPMILADLRRQHESWESFWRPFARRGAIERWLRSGVGVGRVSGLRGEDFAPGRTPRARVQSTRSSRTRSS